MTQTAVTQVIAAPVQRVWDVATDLAGFPQVVSGIQGIEVLTDGPFGVGTRWRETRKMYGKEATEEMVVTVSEPPHRYVTTADSHGSHYESSYDFRDVGDGKTELTMTFGGEATSLFAKVMWTVTGPLATRSVRKALEKDLAELAAACEKGPNGATEGTAQ